MVVLVLASRSNVVVGRKCGRIGLASARCPRSMEDQIGESWVLEAFFSAGWSLVLLLLLLLVLVGISVMKK